ncbi:GGDEF domain-containing protein [soil metagenome]
MARQDLRLYDRLSKLGWPKTYGGKIMLVAFVGTHIPLLATVTYAVRATLSKVTKARIILMALIATITGAAGTLYAMHKLLEPIKRTSQSLHYYLEENKIPDAYNLPEHYPDQAGRLMADTRFAIQKLDRVIRNLEILSTHDYLTGLYNRRSCEMRLEEDIARSKREGIPISLAVLDMNRFKQINDEYGHAVGDAALKHVVAIINDGIRAGDWAARWGGDEFLIGFFNTGEMQAHTTIDRLRELVERKPLELASGEQIPLSFKAGIRQHNGTDLAGDFFRKADAALISRREPDSRDNV